jgi:Holliday junction resolvase RusA-like endonuclease
VDNFAKAVLDAITRSNFGWDDDDQILELKVTKRFAEADEQPRSDIKWRTASS